MNVRSTLSKFEYLESRRYGGDLEAADTLMDLQRAIDHSKLSSRQRLFIHQYYVLGLTGDEIGMIHGIGRHGVANVLRRAERKIQRIVDKWGVANV